MGETNVFTKGNKDVKLKRIFSASLLVLLTTAPFTMGYSATLVENAETSAAVRLQPIFAERRNETVDKVFLLVTGDDSEFTSNYFFPEQVPSRGTYIHNDGHLWPKKYLNSTFKHGLLNTMINYSFKENQKVPIGVLEFLDRKIARSNVKYEERILTCPSSIHRCFLSEIFKERAHNLIEYRRDIYVKFQRAFQEGLQENERLVDIGSNYLKHKIREEKRGIKGTARERAEETHRGDLLQDAAYTIVLHATKIMNSVLDVIKNDPDLQGIQKSDVKPAHDDLLNETINNYAQDIKTFFRAYRPAINDMPEEAFGMLELIDLGREDIRAVPLNYKHAIDSLV
ncbi:MAG: hypothetical protein V4544_06895 [Pseudomonadota bacterium]